MGLRNTGYTINLRETRHPGRSWLEVSRVWSAASFLLPQKKGETDCYYLGLTSIFMTGHSVLTPIQTQITSRKGIGVETQV